MKKAAVVIGVDRPGQLPKLNAAAKGAVDFADWARSNGYEVELLTDTGGAVVTYEQVKHAVGKFASTGTYDSLIVYFSGHGLRPNPNEELWLLTKSPGDSTEAVNVNGSIRLAQRSGIPVVTIISDACRSLPEDLIFQEVAGGKVFPNVPEPDVLSKIDTFYASKAGQVAYEAKVGEVAAQHKGVFTDILLKCLRGEVPQVITDIDSPKPAAVVTPQSLEDHVPGLVEEAISDINLKAKQRPQITPTSRPPHYLAEFPPRRPVVNVDLMDRSSGTGTSGSVTDMATEHLTERITKGTGGTRPRPGIKPKPAPAEDLFRAKDLHELIKDDPAITRDIDCLVGIEGRDHFETQTGFTIHGAHVTNAYSDCGDCEPLGGSPMHIRQRFMGDRRRKGSIVIELDGRQHIVLAVLFGYIGTVVVQDGHVATVNYTPSSNSDHYGEYMQAKEKLDRRRAVVATLAAHGRFQVDAEHASQSAEYLRTLKSIDPTLGLYAAYAYQRAGLIKDIRSVYDWMSHEDTVVPYDIALLADKLDAGRAAPFCPMLMQGWAYLDEDRPDQMHLLRELRRYVQPGLWTTFRHEATNVLRNMIHR